MLERVKPKNCGFSLSFLVWKLVAVSRLFHRSSILCGEHVRVSHYRALHIINCPEKSFTLLCPGSVLKDLTLKTNIETQSYLHVKICFCLVHVQTFQNVTSTLTFGCPTWRDQCTNSPLGIIHNIVNNNGQCTDIPCSPTTPNEIYYL